MSESERLGVLIVGPLIVGALAGLCIFPVVIMGGLEWPLSVFAGALAGLAAAIGIFYGWLTAALLEAPE